MRLAFNRYGKLTDDAAIESLNDRLRREFFNQSYFMNSNDAQRSIEHCQADYTSDRPHSSLGNEPPDRIRATVSITASFLSTVQADDFSGARRALS